MSRKAVIRVVLTLILGLWLVPCVTLADEEENQKIGFSPNHVFEGSLRGENIDVLTGNVTLGFPIGPRMQLNQSFGCLPLRNVSLV
jgi:hypothetical protein